MLTQRRFFTTRTFAVATDGIDVTERGLTWSRSYRVPFGHIPSQPERLSVSSGGWLGATVIFALVSGWAAVAAARGADLEGVVWLVWGGLAVAAGGFYAASRRRFVIFRSAEPGLVVFEGKPSVVELESFLKEMHQRRVACIGEQTLLTSGADLPADLGERLRWLHAAGLLSAVEVQELLTGLAGRGKNQSLRLQ